MLRLRNLVFICVNSVFLLPVTRLGLSPKASSQSVLMNRGGAQSLPEVHSPVQYPSLERGQICIHCVLLLLLLHGFPALVHIGIAKVLWRHGHLVRHGLGLGLHFAFEVISTLARFLIRRISTSMYTTLRVMCQIDL